MATLKKIKKIIGWEEWCAFPDLNLPAVKAKVDTGAKTSCLHVFNMYLKPKKGITYVYFDTHPIQKNKKIVKRCRAPLVDYRSVTNSGGQREKRYVIQTTLSLGSVSFPIELTLAKRDTMAFRMLLGREAMRDGGFLVDPAKSCVQKKMTSIQAKQLYL